MKKTFLLFCLIAFRCLTAFSQIQIGSAETAVMNRAGKLEDEDLVAFKKMTTVFFIQSGDANRKADFEKALREVWTINPFIVATPDEMNIYRDGHKYAPFGFGGFIVQRRSSGGMVSTSTHLTYDLSIPQFKKNGEQKDRTLLARIILMPDSKTMMESAKPLNSFNNSKQEANMLRMMYTKSEFNNWGAGFLKGYAKFINDALLAKERRGIFNETRDKEELKNLKKATLYLPSYTKSKLNMFTGGEKEADDDGADEDLSKAYPFPVQYLENDALEEKILNATEPFYYLQYVRSSTDKFITIFEGKSGKLLYSEYVPVSYNFKMKDLKKVAQLIN